MRNLTKILSIALICFLFTSCVKDVVFKERKTFKDNNWIRIDNDLTFEVPIENIDENYDIILSLRYATIYAAPLLKFQLIMVAPSGQTRSTDGAFVIRDREGKWQGDGMGDLFDIVLPVRKYMAFNEKGTYKFILKNLMDTYDNHGVMDIALEVKRAKLDVKVDD